MEGKIKYGMFDLTIGIDLQHELVGLLEQKDKNGKEEPDAAGTLRQAPV